jgi:hypothetical protein
MYRRFVRLRLRWYTRASGDLVVRHWQWFVLGCLLVPGPPVIAIFLHAASLLAASVAPGMAPAQHFFLATVIDVAAVLWILPQRHALSGGSFMRYAEALPLRRLVRLSAEATLLVAANAVLLVSAGIAVAQIWSPGDLYAPCCLLALLGLAGAAQQAVLNRRWIVLPGIVLGNGALALGLAAQVAVARWLLLMPAIGSATICMVVAVGLERTRGAGRPGMTSRAVAPALRILARRVPALLTQCRTIAERPAQTILRFGTATGLALGADRLMAIFQFDGRTFPTVILAMAMISLLLAGFYRMLSDARRTMGGYLAALPLPSWYWAVRDTKFVLLLNGVPLVILLSPQIMRGLLSLLIVFALAVTCQVLLAVLRWPVVYGGRRSLIYGVLLAALWSGAAIAAVSR